MKPRTKRILKLALTFIVVLIIFPFAAFGLNEIGKSLGFRSMSVSVAGTGSMYPSLFWEKSEGGPEDPSTTTIEEYRTSPNMYRYIPPFNFFGKTIELHKLSYGDMVAFQNAATKKILAEEGRDQEAGFIKRIIGLPGDVIEIRDGFVIRNGERIDEPYIYKPRSTYGGSSLPDCNQLTIGSNEIFILGDNRKSSTDSRSGVGLVNKSDISFTLPFDKQEVYHKLWRDTSKDSELANQPTLDTKKFYQMLNDVRKNSGANPLKLDSRLANSAAARAKIMLKTNDFSTEATRSGYTMKQALADAGYSNIVTGEFISHGYYTAEELIQNLTYFSETKSQVTNPDYQDIGLAVINGEINSCPTQVIVGHLGGYVPAEYSADVVASWKALKDNLEEVIPSWEKARAYPQIDQQKLEQLLTILNTRKALASEVYNAMINKLWLTSDQKARIDQDSSLANQANQLVNELNQQ